MISNEKLFEVAVEYHIKKKLQREIAEEYGVSRVQISKYLKLAEDRGIVETSLNPPNISSENQEKYQYLFNKYFGLKKLILTPGTTNSDKLHPFLINHAGQWIMDHLVNNNREIGVGWGRTIHDLSLFPMETKKASWSYYPLSFLEDMHIEDYFNYNIILPNFANNFGGTADKTFLNALSYTGKGMEAFIHHFWKRLDTVICGVGHAFPRFPQARDKVFSDTVMQSIKSKDLIGDFINYYFDINGEVYIMNQSERTIPLDILRGIPEKIAIAGGYQKIESIIGAMRASLIDTLITDIKTAKNIIEYVG